MRTEARLVLCNDSEWVLLSFERPNGHYYTACVPNFSHLRAGVDGPVLIVGVVRNLLFRGFGKFFLI